MATKLRIRCQYEGVSGRRYGQIQFKFAVDEQDMAEALRIVLGKDRDMKAAIKHNDDIYVLGPVTFGGLVVKANGDTVIKLDTTLADLRLDIKSLRSVCEEYVMLLVGIADAG